MKLLAFATLLTTTLSLVIKRDYDTQLPFSLYDSTSDFLFGTDNMVNYNTYIYNGLQTYGNAVQYATFFLRNGNLVFTADPTKKVGLQQSGTGYNIVVGPLANAAVSWTVSNNQIRPVVNNELLNIYVSAVPAGGFTSGLFAAKQPRTNDTAVNLQLIAPTQQVPFSLYDDTSKDFLGSANMNQGDNINMARNDSTLRNYFKYNKFLLENGKLVFADNRTTSIGLRSVGVRYLLATGTLAKVQPTWVDNGSQLQLSVNNIPFYYYASSLSQNYYTNGLYVDKSNTLNYQQFYLKKVYNI